ncbi:MAG: polyprenol monophosphomannose synthase, partial [Sediminibacterium sp.]
NEKENILSIVNTVLSLQGAYDILVIDDGSPDGTAQIIKDNIPKHPGRLFLEERSGKLGLGTAYIHGFKWALANQYDYIFEMDADFSHNPNDLERLYNACEKDGADVAIGSRYVKGGATENWPLDRLIYSKGGSAYTRIITGMPVKDPTAGFVCYKNKVLATINLDNIKFIGYAFQIEMKFASWRLGFKLKEVPITFVDRKIGISKMSKGIIKEAILGVLHMQWQHITGRFIKSIKRVYVSLFL